MLVSGAGIEQNLVKDAASLSKLKKDQWSSLINVSRALSEAPLYIDDTTNISPRYIHDKLCRISDDHKIGLVVIDYLQLMSADSSASTRDQEISGISSSLKVIAKEFNAPVVVLSQLNRNLEERWDKRPRLSDFRESWAIEKESDTILFIYRDEGNDFGSDQVNHLRCLENRSKKAPFQGLEGPFYPQKEGSKKNDSGQWGEVYY